MSENPSNESYIVEYIALGNSVKATAFDPITFMEVSVIGSAKTSRSDLGKVAVRKLEYMIRKAGNR